MKQFVCGQKKIYNEIQAQHFPCFIKCMNHSRIPAKFSSFRYKLIDWDLLKNSIFFRSKFIPKFSKLSHNGCLIELEIEFLINLYQNVGKSAGSGAIHVSSKNEDRFSVSVWVRSYATNVNEAKRKGKRKILFDNKYDGLNILF